MAQGLDSDCPMEEYAVEVEDSPTPPTLVTHFAKDNYKFAWFK